MEVRTPLSSYSAAAPAHGRLRSECVLGCVQSAASSQNGGLTKWHQGWGRWEAGGRPQVCKMDVAGQCLLCGGRGRGLGGGGGRGPAGSGVLSPPTSREEPVSCLPPHPGRFHPGVCWGDRWGDWGEMRQAPRTGWASWETFSGEGGPPPHTWPLPASTSLRESPGPGCWLDLCPGRFPAHLEVTAAQRLCRTECPGPDHAAPIATWEGEDLPITWAQAGQAPAEVGFESRRVWLQGPCPVCVPRGG